MESIDSIDAAQAADDRSDDFYGEENAALSF
jgi:hypothetical protein